ERVHEDVPLASVDALPAVEPARPAGVARLHRLAVDDGGRRARLPPGLPPDGAAEPVAQPREEAAVTPAPEVVVDRLPGRIRVGEVAPLAPGLREVEHGVEDVSGVVLDRAVTSQQRGDTFPLSVRQVGAVASRAHGSGRLVSGLGLVQTPTGAHRLQLTRSPNSLSEPKPRILGGPTLN